VRVEFTAGLRAAETAEELVSLVEGAVALPEPQQPAPAPAAPATEQPAPAEQPAVRRSLVAVTACPTGIAHTYMAAEALEAAAARAGVDIHVETQGSAGSTPLAADKIVSADAAIFAADVGVRDRYRFAGKPVVASGVKRAIDDGDAMIAEALAYATDPDAPRVEGAGEGRGSTEHRISTGDEPWGLKIRRILMTGVSYMIPFVAAGGLLIALSFLLGGYEITGPAGAIVTDNTLFNLPNLQESGLEHALFDSPVMAYLGALFFVLGATAFKFLVPALAGYIAYAIADRPGIAPGFVMGAIAIDLGGFGTPQTGFLGGIIGGVLAGVIAHWIAKWQVAGWLRGLMPVLIIPLVTTLVAGLVMVVVLGKPLGALMDALNDGLTSMAEGGAGVALGVVLGLMMAFDMGGPLNKTAYLFATTGLAAAATATGDAPQLLIMAAVMLAGMVPPLALALASAVRPKLFTETERENGKAAWLLGASFITEGAIPFAAADPLRVIPAMMAGSAVTGATVMLSEVTLRAPHGGIFVFFAMTKVAWFVGALALGTLVAAAAVVALKQFTARRAETPARAAVTVG